MGHPQRSEVKINTILTRRLAKCEVELNILRVYHKVACRRMLMDVQFRMRVEGVSLDCAAIAVTKVFKNRHTTYERARAHIDKILNDSAESELFCGQEENMSMFTLNSFLVGGSFYPSHLDRSHQIVGSLVLPTNHSGVWLY